MKDALVKVNDLTCPSYFYVINMSVDSSSCDLSVLLSRPFLKTDHPLVDVDNKFLKLQNGVKI